MQKTMPYLSVVPYLFSYKAEIFPFQNNPYNLDPSSKTDLNFYAPAMEEVG